MLKLKEEILGNAGGTSTTSSTSMPGTSGTSGGNSASPKDIYMYGVGSLAIIVVGLIVFYFKKPEKQAEKQAEKTDDNQTKKRPTL